MTNNQTENKGTLEVVETNYPYWKILAWRFIRAFFWGGFTSMLSLTIFVSSDLSDWNLWIFALIAAFLNGGFQSLGKVVRDTVSQGDNTSPVEKLPI